MKRFRSKGDEGTTLGLGAALICYVAALVVIFVFVLPFLVSLFD